MGMLYHQHIIYIYIYIYIYIFGNCLRLQAYLHFCIFSRRLSLSLLIYIYIYICVCVCVCVCVYKYKGHSMIKRNFFKNIKLIFFVFFLINLYTQYAWSKVGDLSRGCPEDSLFNSFDIDLYCSTYPWSVPHNAEYYAMRHPVPFLTLPGPLANTQLIRPVWNNSIGNEAIQNGSKSATVCLVFEKCKTWNLLKNLWCVWRFIF